MYVFINKYSFSPNRSRRPWNCGDLAKCKGIWVFIFLCQCDYTILRLWLRVKVKRIAITSSSISLVNPREVTAPKLLTDVNLMEVGKIADMLTAGFLLSFQADWNESSVENVKKLGNEAKPIDIYGTSKTLAESSAWEWIEKNKASFDLVTILPPWVSMILFWIQIRFADVTSPIVQNFGVCCVLVPHLDIQSTKSSTPHTSSHLFTVYRRRRN